MTDKQTRRLIQLILICMIAYGIFFGQSKTTSTSISDYITGQHYLKERKETKPSPEVTPPLSFLEEKLNTSLHSPASGTKNNPATIEESENNPIVTLTSESPGSGALAMCGKTVFFEATILDKKFPIYHSTGAFPQGIPQALTEEPSNPAWLVNTMEGMREGGSRDIIIPRDLLLSYPAFKSIQSTVSDQLILQLSLLRVTPDLGIRFDQDEHFIKVVGAGKLIQCSTPFSIHYRIENAKGDLLKEILYDTTSSAAFLGRSLLPIGLEYALLGKAMGTEGTLLVIPKAALTTKELEGAEKPSFLLPDEKLLIRYEVAP